MLHIHVKDSTCLNRKVRLVYHLLFYVCFLVHLSACSDEEILALQPQIEVTAGLSFGQAIIAQPNILVLTVSNKGAGVLSFENITVVDGGEVFEVGQYPADLGPNQTIEIEIRFTPIETRTPYNGLLSIQTNDPENEKIDVTLDGIGGFRRISVEPRVLDFGTVDEGAGVEQTS